MTLDPYKPCPCGGGKKVKFCCSKDIAGELDAVMRMIEGEQRMAAVERLNKLIASKGERAALLALKGSVQMQLGEVDAAKSTVATFLVQHQDNPVALAQSALLEASDRNFTTAVEGIQRAIEAIDKTMPMTVYEALGAVGQALLMGGNVLAARSHLLLQASFADEDDTRAMQMLMRLHSSPEIPLLMKQDWEFAECPPDVAWSELFNAAMDLANRGAWLAAVEKLDSLAHNVAREPAIRKNVAILRSYLGDTETIVQCWRRYAQLESIPLDEAVEAEALAQLLDPDSGKDKTDVVNVSYPVRDMDRLSEVLASDRRVMRMPVNPSEFAAEDEPPPKSVFWLLDRPLPASGEGLTRDAVPMAVGELFLYGKQTDREARLEFDAVKTDDFENKTAVLADLAGDLIGPAEKEEVKGQIASVSAALTFNWRFPKDTPMQLRNQLIAEQRNDVILNRWPELSLSVLGGRRPCDVASDPAYRVRLLAAILLLELAGGAQNLTAMDFNELRSKLGLPTADDIDPADVDIMDLSLMQLSRLMAEKLSDDDLIECYARAGRLGATAALERLTNEVVRRESLDERVDKVEAHELLARLTDDNDQAFAHIEKARNAAVERGSSPAPWLIAELTLRMERGVADGVEGLIELIQSRHIREPGVAQGLYSVLVRFGILTPDGQPAGSMGEPEAELPAASEPADEPKTLWTPDSPAEPSQSGEGKSKLWIPGSE